MACFAWQTGQGSRWWPTTVVRLEVRWQLLQRSKVTKGLKAVEWSRLQQRDSERRAFWRWSVKGGHCFHVKPKRDRYEWGSPVQTYRTSNSSSQTTRKKKQSASLDWFWGLSSGHLHKLRRWSLAITETRCDPRRRWVSERSCPRMRYLCSQPDTALKDGKSWDWKGR